MVFFDLILFNGFYGEGRVFLISMVTSSNCYCTSLVKKDRCEDIYVSNIIQSEWRIHEKSKTMLFVGLPELVHIYS